MGIQPFVKILSHGYLHTYEHNKISTMPPSKPSTTGQSKARSNVSNSHILMRQHQMHFAEADQNRDGELDFEEFDAALPDVVRAKFRLSERKKWFRMIDTSGNGRITLDEQFAWAVNAAALASGAGVKKIFASYDRDGSGELTELEFCKAAREMGVGDDAERLFHSLPGSADGSVCYLDLVERAQAQKAENTTAMRSFLTAMAWDSVADTNEIDTRGWSFTASDAAGVRVALASLLETHGVKLSQIFEKLDLDDDNLISQRELVGAMVECGYEGDEQLLRDIFEQLDDDRTGSVGFDELDAWMRGEGTGKSVRMARVPFLKLRVELTGSTEGVDEPWSADMLRSALIAMLKTHGVRATDLTESLDDDGSGRQDGVVRRRHLLQRLKRMVDDQYLWDLKVRPAVDAMLQAVAPNGKTLDADNFHRWLRVAGKSPEANASAGSRLSAAAATGRSHGKASSCAPHAIASSASALAPAPSSSSALARRPSTGKARPGQRPKWRRPPPSEFREETVDRLSRPRSASRVYEEHPPFIASVLDNAAVSLALASAPNPYDAALRLSASPQQSWDGSGEDYHDGGEGYDYYGVGGEEYERSLRETPYDPQEQLLRTPLRSPNQRSSPSNSPQSRPFTQEEERYILDLLDAHGIVSPPRRPHQAETSVAATEGEVNHMDPPPAMDPPLPPAMGEADQMTDAASHAIHDDHLEWTEEGGAPPPPPRDPRLNLPHDLPSRGGGGTSSSSLESRRQRLKNTMDELGTFVGAGATYLQAALGLAGYTPLEGSEQVEKWDRSPGKPMTLPVSRPGLERVAASLATAAARPYRPPTTPEFTAWAAVPPPTQHRPEAYYTTCKGTNVLKLGGGRRGASAAAARAGVRFVACARPKPTSTSTTAALLRRSSTAPQLAHAQLPSQPRTPGARTDSHNSSSSAPWWSSLPPHSIVPLTGPMLVPRSSSKRQAEPQLARADQMQRLLYVPVQEGANRVVLQPSVLLER